jgi:2-polyprenyl-6-methoxyphenol hydroxylase-like FAD-dependent oxidoreductase
MQRTALNLAVVGAGPVGLALALHAARALPQAQISLFDARVTGHDVVADPRTLALALGSVQLLQRLQAWPEEAAQPITTVHVSQAPPSPAPLLGTPEVRLDASAEKVPMLGAVLSYGALVARLQAAWLAAAQAEPQRLHTRFGTAVAALKPLPGAWSWTPASPRASTSPSSPKAASSPTRRARHWCATTGRRPGSAPSRWPARRRARPSSASRATARWRCCR